MVISKTKTIFILIIIIAYFSIARIFFFKVETSFEPQVIVQEKSCEFHSEVSTETPTPTPTPTPTKPSINEDIDGFYIRGKKQTYKNNIFISTNKTRNTFVPRCSLIDVVYTWVNGSDPIHMETKLKYLNESGKVFRPESIVDARYRDYGVLKYSLRSIRKNAPWVNKIFIVTANQVPSWFNTSNSDNVEFIFHDEFYKNKSHLPTFNSNSIESNFFNLPRKVSNCFMYLNDDIFFRLPVNISDFYDARYNFHIYQSNNLISSYTRLPKDTGIVNSMFHTAMILNNKLLDKLWFPSPRYRGDHGVIALNRNLLKMMYDSLTSLSSSTSSNKFRGVEDMNLSFVSNQFAKRYATFEIKPLINSYSSLTESNFYETFNNLNQTTFPYKTVCLNDILDEFDDKKLETINNFFNYHFPDPSPYENKIN